MIDSYSVYLPRPQEDLRAWLQNRWDRISDTTFFIVHRPGPQDVAGEYQVLMCIHHAGPDPRPMSKRADELLRQAIERQKVPLSQLEEPFDGAELHEAYTPIPESWLESVYNAITLKVTAFDSGINEIFITVGDSRAADRCQVFVQQLMEIPGAKLASVEPAKRDEDAPKIGAPRLADLDDVQAADKKSKLREYLRYIYYENRSQTFAADKVGPARTTLERYRDHWPEVETGVKAEIEAKAQKVRKA